MTEYNDALWTLRSAEFRLQLMADVIAGCVAAKGTLPKRYAASYVKAMDHYDDCQAVAIALASSDY